MPFLVRPPAGKPASDLPGKAGGKIDFPPKPADYGPPYSLTLAPEYAATAMVTVVVVNLKFLYVNAKFKAPEAPWLAVRTTSFTKIAPRAASSMRIGT